MITVTNTNDSGSGSLRDAIAVAAPGEEIQFSTSGIIALTTGELLIVRNLTITGPGTGMIVIDGGGLSRVFNTNVGVISISGLTILNGLGSQGGGIHNEATLTLSDVDVTSCTSTDEGGGIWNSSTITMTDVTVVGCVAASGNGGGIHNTGTITATDVSVDTCSASGDGGGLWTDGTYEQTDGEITGCTNTLGGGGVYTEGTTTLTQVSIFSNDCGGNGDGLLNNLGTVSLVRCAVYNNDQINIYSTLGTNTIANSTVSGGGTVLSAIILASGAVANIANSTITQHGSGIHASSGCFVSLYNTILAGNDGNDADVFTADVISNGNNILGVDSNEPITDAAGDQRVLDYASLLLGPMQDNGGFTFTHALLEDSPAVDAGNNIDAPDTDQRGTGFTRIFNTTIDIGAFEFQEEEPEPPGPDPEPEPPEPEPEPTPTLGQPAPAGECRRVACCTTTGVQFSDFTYSLVSGQTYTNNEFTLVVPCPVGYDCTADSVTIVLPPGTVKFTPTRINPNPPRSGSGDPWDPEPGTYEFTCGNQTLTIRTATAFTQAQIDAIVDFLSRCQANQNAIQELEPTPVLTPSGQPGIRIWNTEQTYTAECPEDETGNPVTVTIPAKTHSTVILATSTPLQQYLAQQEINTFTLNEAAAQAEAELECTPAVECPELKSTFVPFVTSIVYGSAYGLTQNLTYFSSDSLALGLNIYGIDDTDAVAVSASFAPDGTNQGTMAYSELHNSLYISCNASGVPTIRVLAAATLTLVADVDVSGLSPAAGRVVYLEGIDMLAATFDSNYIALIECTGNTISASAADVNPGGLEVAYVPSNGRIYCPTSFSTPEQVTIRDTSLVVTGSINLAGFIGMSGIVLAADNKLVMAAFDSEWRVKVIDPGTDTVTNTIATGLSFGGDSAISYDPTFDLVYIYLQPNLVVFDPHNEVVLCTINLTGSTTCKQIGVNTTTDRFYLAIANVGAAIRKYGQP